jgi:hypothetical protein
MISNDYKQSLLVFNSLSIIAVNCSKSDRQSVIHYTQVRVLEVKSNRPVAGVTISLQKCIKYSIDWGCIDFADILNTSTDRDGVYQYDNRLKVSRVSVSHPNYWSWTFDYSAATLLIIPYAFIKLHLKNIGNTYSSLAKIQIDVNNPDNIDFFTTNFLNFSSLTINYLPQDSVVFLTGFGNIENDVYWTITDGNITTSNQFPSQVPNAFDAVRSEIDY